MSKETPPNLVARTGIEPVRDVGESSPIVVNTSIADSDTAPKIATQIEISPQLSPKSGPTVRRHKSNQAYATPPNLIRACEAKFQRRIVWDLAAGEHNAKADKWYDAEMNSLVQPWHQISAPGGLLWLNPPFDEIGPWAEKCAAESIQGCAPILMLTPASIGTNWFRDFVFRQAMVFALNGRIQFVGASDPYPKDLMLSVYGLGASGFSIWTPEKLALL